MDPNLPTISEVPRTKYPCTTNGVQLFLIVKISAWTNRHIANTQSRQFRLHPLYTTTSLRICSPNFFENHRKISMDKMVDPRYIRICPPTEHKYPPQMPLSCHFIIDIRNDQKSLRITDIMYKRMSFFT